MGSQALTLWTEPLAVVSDNLDRLLRFQAVDAQWGLMTKAQAVQLPRLPGGAYQRVGVSRVGHRNEGRHFPPLSLLRACGKRLCIAAKYSRLMSVISPGAVSGPVYLSDQHADAPILHPGARFEQ